MCIIIIHNKINSNYHFTVPGLVEMEIGFGRKIGISKIGLHKIGGSTVLLIVIESKQATHL